MAVFATKGFHAARVDDVVKAAKTSHGTFYLYFANKDELFGALTEEVGDRMVAFAEAFPVVPRGVQGQSALRDWVEAFADLYVESAPVVRAWTEAEVGTSAMRADGLRVVGAFAEAISARLAKGDFDGIDCDAAALAIFAMLERLNYYAYTKQVRLDRGDMVDTVTRVIFAAMYPG